MAAGMDDARDVTAADEHRRLLFGIAYRITGSAADADELVQDAYLRYLRAGPDTVRDPRAFLATAVTRLALDLLRLARTTREMYWGTWLPEPTPTDDVLGPDASVEQRESLALAFLAMLERLTPEERAVFVLREAFAYPYRDIADATGLAEAHCRQLHRRATGHVRADRSRFIADPRHARALLDRFVEACVGGPEPLEAVLAADVTVWGDGGGKASALRAPLTGRDHAAPFIRGLVRVAPAGTAPHIVDVNGGPSLLLAEPRGVIGLYQLSGDADGRVGAIHAMRNPEKLARLAARLGLPVAPPDRA